MSYDANDFKKEAWIELVSRARDLVKERILKTVFEEYRKLDSIPSSAYPFAMFEPDVADPEPESEQYDVEGTSYAIEDFKIIVWLGMNIFEKGKAVAGSEEKLGVLDMEKKFKDAVFGAPTHLDGKVIQARFGKILYLRSATESTEKGHLRILQMEVILRVLYGV